ncbi:uncharacterized protein [Typha angustifolia]|uniref:uncharacterized protein n=1 Tax=Typha angustifolia TaxID=59011 RepID=UPI003C2C7C5D
MMGRLNDDEEVILEDFNLLTSCTILPSLHEGHVTGLSKVLPYCENINKLEELWSYKHGLELHSDYFVAVQLAYGGCTNKEWFPSSFVLQGSGLSPALQTTRVLKAVPTFESFMKLLGG